MDFVDEKNSCGVPFPKPSKILALVPAAAVVSKHVLIRCEGSL